MNWARVCVNKYVEVNSPGSPLILVGSSIKPLVLTPNCLPFLSSSRLCTVITVEVVLMGRNCMDCSKRHPYMLVIYFLGLGRRREFSLSGPAILVNYVLRGMS